MSIDRFSVDKMKPGYRSALLQSLAFLKLLLRSPSLTLRLMTWRRVKNACRVVFSRQGNMGLLLQRYKAIYNVNTEVLDASARSSAGHVGDVVVFPAIDWGFRFQRPQHLTQHLGARGYRVFYVSTVPLLIPGKTNYVVQGNPVPGVVLVQLSSGCFRTPDFYQDELTTDELAGFLKSFEILCAEFGIASPTIVIQQPFWWPLVSRLKGGGVLYDCLDHHAGFHDRPNAGLLGCEQQLVEKADAVVVTSDGLADSFQGTRDCHVIRNGCEFDRFSRAVRRKSPSHPVIGYVGAISGWFDGQLLTEIARERPDWQFDIYGATVGADIAAAKSLPNVNFFGEIPYEKVPDTIAGFDVCIIPFKLIPLTLATNPVKVYEYLAVGRPVVATELPELAGMESIDVFCSSSVEEFILHIGRAIELSDQPERVQVRQDWASQNDWSRRVDKLVSLVNDLAVRSADSSLSAPCSASAKAS